MPSFTLIRLFSGIFILFGFCVQIREVNCLKDHKSLLLSYKYLNDLYNTGSNALTILMGRFEKCRLQMPVDHNCLKNSKMFIEDTSYFLTQQLNKLNQTMDPSRKYLTRVNKSHTDAIEKILLKIVHQNKFGGLIKQSIGCKFPEAKMICFLLFPVEFLTFHDICHINNFHLCKNWQQIIQGHWKQWSNLHLVELKIRHVWKPMRSLVSRLLSCLKLLSFILSEVLRAPFEGTELHKESEIMYLSSLVRTELKVMELIKFLVEAGEINNVFGIGSDPDDVIINELLNWFFNASRPQLDSEQFTSAAESLFEVESLPLSENTHKRLKPKVFPSNARIVNITKLLIQPYVNKPSENSHPSRNSFQNHLAPKSKAGESLYEVFENLEVVEKMLMLDALLKKKHNCSVLRNMKELLHSRPNSLERVLQYCVLSIEDVSLERHSLNNTLNEAALKDQEPGTKLGKINDKVGLVTGIEEKEKIVRTVLKVLMKVISDLRKEKQGSTSNSIDMRYSNDAESLDMLDTNDIRVSSFFSSEHGSEAFIRSTDESVLRTGDEKFWNDKSNAEILEEEKRVVKLLSSLSSHVESATDFAVTTNEHMKLNHLTHGHPHDKINSIEHDIHGPHKNLWNEESRALQNGSRALQNGSRALQNGSRALQNGHKSMDNISHYSVNKDAYLHTTNVTHFYPNSNVSDNLSHYTSNRTDSEENETDTLSVVESILRNVLNNTSEIFSNITQITNLTLDSEPFRLFPQHSEEDFESEEIGDFFWEPLKPSTTPPTQGLFSWNEVIQQKTDDLMSIEKLSSVHDEVPVSHNRLFNSKKQYVSNEHLGSSENVESDMLHTPTFQTTGSQSWGLKTTTEKVNTILNVAGTVKAESAAKWPTVNRKPLTDKAFTNTESPETRIASEATTQIIHRWDLETKKLFYSHELIFSESSEEEISDIQPTTLPKTFRPTNKGKLKVSNHSRNEASNGNVTVGYGNTIKYILSLLPKGGSKVDRIQVVDVNDSIPNVVHEKTNFTSKRTENQSADRDELNLYHDYTDIIEPKAVDYTEIEDYYVNYNVPDRGLWNDEYNSLDDDESDESDKDVKRIYQIPGSKHTNIHLDSDESITHKPTITYTYPSITANISAWNTVDVSDLNNDVDNPSDGPVESESEVNPDSESSSLFITVSVVVAILVIAAILLYMYTSNQCGGGRINSDAECHNIPPESLAVIAERRKSVQNEAMAVLAERRRSLQADSHGLLSDRRIENIAAIAERYSDIQPDARSIRITT